MGLDNLTKEELIHQNEELREELNQLKTKYVWGLQVEDFASASIDRYEPIDDVFSEDELSDDELHFRAFHALKSTESYSMYGWAEDVSEASLEFSDDTMKLLRTVAKRWLGYNRVER